MDLNILYPESYSSPIVDGSDKVLQLGHDMQRQTYNRDSCLRIVAVFNQKLFWKLLILVLLSNIIEYKLQSSISKQQSPQSVISDSSLSSYCVC